eukprot:6881074-Alexandrium_andersonii.AAC.1
MPRVNIGAAARALGLFRRAALARSRFVASPIDFQFTMAARPRHETCKSRGSFWPASAANMACRICSARAEIC